MQVTYEDIKWAEGQGDELAPEETRHIPFFGFATATLISLGMWSVVAWTVWAIIH